MIERKLILCAILAITIGIATIVPLEYMMSAQAQENTQQENATQQSNTEIPNVQPLFSDVNVTYAYCNPNATSTNDTMTLYGASIAVIANFTLNPDALKNADVQIEYYKFAVSSDQGSIINMGYYILLESNSAIVTGMGGSEGTINFANGLTFNGPTTTGQDINFGCGGQGINYPVWPSNYSMGYISNFVLGTDPNNPPQAAAELQKAQTLYIDVTKICTVTVSGNVTITTPGSDQILQHIVLPKMANGYGFIYGTYTPGTLPIPGPIDGTTPPPNTSETNQTDTVWQSSNSTLSNP
jgi:hypothetical protein